MVKLREIPRTATFAWSPGATSPFLATGTRAGAVDADFSNDTQLELWDLKLSNPSQGVELHPAASIGTDSRFHDIAWVQPKGFSTGVVAGALENGSLDLWDAGKLLDGDEDSFMSRTSKHSGAIKTLQFNPFRSELLATAGAQGELFISDLNNIANPFRLGNATAARADDFECLDWNKKVPHIMVTGSNGGFVTVWDVKTKKESLTLNNLGRKPVSAVAWDPEKSTRLITAVPLDTDPIILVWDLRNSNAPERVLRGHDGGVLSLSWCHQDSDLLLSCGKDNRTLCWNPQTGEAYGEFPVVTNWTFQTRWNPQNPNMLATASFNGKISVQTIQNTSAGKVQSSGTQSQISDGEDFFDKAVIQPQSSTFTLPKAPKWLEKPCGVSFGFGGKLVKFSSAQTDGTQSRHSNINLSDFFVDADIVTMTDAFEKAMDKSDLSGVCKTRIAQAKSEDEKNDWKVIETLISANPRKDLVNYLGFSKTKESVDKMLELDIKGDSAEDLAALKTNGAKNNRLSAFFDSGIEGDSFLSDLSATKGAKTNNPFHIYSGSESSSDRKITQALMLGQFDEAMEICLREDRISDAFMIAICGGQQCIDKVQKAYFMKQEGGHNYLRLLASVVGKNLWDVVYNADIENWREAMAILCTYANTEEFPDLCEALGDRLEEQMVHKPNQPSLRNDASFCYIAGSKLEKVVGVWVAELENQEGSGLQEGSKDTTFSVHARSLQSFIEKVTVFREVTQYQYTDCGAKLAQLYEKYAEYADILAAHGHLETAEKYLDLLPDSYSAAEIARNRVKQAARKSTSVPTGTSTGNTSVLSNRAPMNVPDFEDQRVTSFKQTRPTAKSYAPASLNQPQEPYASQGSSPYGRPIYQPSQPSQPPQRNAYGLLTQPTYSGPSQSSNIGPPTRNFTSPPLGPLSKDKQMSNWNDIPENFGRPVTSRRGTPGVNASLPNQLTMSTPPMAGQPFGVPPRSTPPAPPPRGPPPPPRTTTSHSNGPGSYQQPKRTSSVTNSYAPTHTSNHLGSSQPPPQVPRGSSPYNAPPSGPPPSNRYAPAPAAPTQAPALVNQRPLPPNPYVTQPSYTNPQPPATAPYGSPSVSPRQTGPPISVESQVESQVAQQESRPSTAQSQRGDASKTATSRYLPGDRTHIPTHAQLIYEVLNEDMQRVKARAPASYKVQVNDTEKRLNILFDHLNNQSLLKPNTIEDMVQLAQALRSRNYDQAQAIHIDILTNRNEECGNWMTGVKRLIGMSKVIA